MSVVLDWVQTFGFVVRRERTARNRGAAETVAPERLPQTAAFALVLEPVPLRSVAASAPNIVFQVAASSSVFAAEPPSSAPRLLICHPQAGPERHPSSALQVSPVFPWAAFNWSNEAWKILNLVLCAARKSSAGVR